MKKQNKTSPFPWKGSIALGWARLVFLFLTYIHSTDTGNKDEPADNRLVTISGD
jgi:hypothetical protein